MCGNEAVNAVVENAEGRPISRIAMTASYPAQGRKFRLTVAAVGCVTFATSSLAFSQDAPARPPSAQEQADKSASASSARNPSKPSTNLDDLYFGPPVMPPSHIWRAEEPSGKPREESSVKAVRARPQTKRQIAKPTRTQPGPRNMVATAPTPRAKTKKATVAMYKEAIATQASAFGDERSFQWRKCIPGIQMPLVCYLPAKERARIIVHPVD